MTTYHSRRIMNVRRVIAADLDEMTTLLGQHWEQMKSEAPDGVLRRVLGMLVNLDLSIKESKPGRSLIVGTTSGHQPLWMPDPNGPPGAVIDYPETFAVNVLRQIPDALQPKKRK